MLLQEEQLPGFSQRILQLGVITYILITKTAAGRLLFFMYDGLAQWCEIGGMLAHRVFIFKSQCGI